ncbi:hypothetical protein C0993_008064 [Termitomyces sp. T159_Od127]|nr:hypothetical protein C0993_008064 [Termitomyces sp. T159_Od127]
MPTPRVIAAAPLATADAKWISLKKLTYLDADGKQRAWEYAERKTRKASGVDGEPLVFEADQSSSTSAVAILAILRSKTNAFPVSTIVIEQYRPPIDKYIIELPAGLVDEDESPEQAAIRELEEETGFRADSMIDSSPVIVPDPGMTNANMKLVVLTVTLDDKLELPEQKLDPGEFIVPRIVELAKLKSELKDYDKRGFVIDARLSHFATGYDLANQLARAGLQ